MKIKITKPQYNTLVNFITEARTAPIPTNLTSFFKKYKNIGYFGVAAKYKHETEYMFKVDIAAGFVGVTDINPGTKTAGCSSQVNPDTMLYGDEFTFTCKGKSQKINNVIGVILYDEQKNKIGELPIDSPASKKTDELIDVYEDDLRRLTNGDEVFIDTEGSKPDYDGIVTNNTSDGIEIETNVVGKTGNPFKLLISDSEPAFFEENGKIIFKAIKRDESGENEFSVPIKKFKTSKAPVQQEPEQPDPNIDLDDEELINAGEKALEMIHKDKDLQNAFYKSDGFWDLFISELTGKKSPGSGILPVLQMLTKYGHRKLNEKLGSDFKKNKPISFKAYKKPISIPYVSNKQKKNFTIDTMNPRRAWLRDYQIGDSDYILENRMEKFTVIIKEKTTIPDVYLCDVRKYVESADSGIVDNVEENVQLQFLRTSEGYTPTK